MDKDLEIKRLTVALEQAQALTQVLQSEVTRLTKMNDALIHAGSILANRVRSYIFQINAANAIIGVIPLTRWDSRITAYFNKYLRESERGPCENNNTF